jgi:hypothetical protein
MSAVLQQGRALRREEDRVALEAWAGRRRERLAREPEEVRAEILSEARARLQCLGRIEWSEADNELCRMRVLSRLRLKRYGAIPDGREWLRQVEEIRAGLGLALREAS